MRLNTISGRVLGLGGIILIVILFAAILAANAWVNNKFKDEGAVQAPPAVPLPADAPQGSQEVVPAQSLPHLGPAQPVSPTGSESPLDEERKIIYEKPLNDVILVQ